jgi:tripartite-type tricarboxylate transporter receptor subunit TctC
MQNRYAPAFLTVSLSALTLGSSVEAQEFAPKQITVIVGFPAAGGTDLFARLFAQKLAAAFATNAIVDNRPGAAGTLGTNAVVRSAPNGQTLLFTPSTIAMTKATYDPRGAAAPCCRRRRRRGSTPAELAAHLASEIDVYTRLARRLALKPE